MSNDIGELNSMNPTTMSAVSPNTSSVFQKPNVMFLIYFIS